MGNAERIMDDNIIPPSDQAKIDRVLETVGTKPINPDVVEILGPGYIDSDGNSVFKEDRDTQALADLIKSALNKNQ